MNDALALQMNMPSCKMSQNIPKVTNKSLFEKFLFDLIFGCVRTDINRNLCILSPSSFHLEPITVLNSTMSSKHWIINSINDFEQQIFIKFAVVLCWSEGITQKNLKKTVGDSRHWSMPSLSLHLETPLVTLRPIVVDDLKIKKKMGATRVDSRKKNNPCFSL